MSRKCKEGDETILEKAAEAIYATSDAHELRCAQAFLLSYTLGFTLDQVAVIIGKSYATTERLRKEFFLYGERQKTFPKRLGRTTKAKHDL
jgi:DNA-directed RNA polymerase specialized sigma24 family protein